MRPFKSSHMKKNNYHSIICCLYFFIAIFYFSGMALAKEPDESFTLTQTIAKAIYANLGLKSYEEETRAAFALKKVRQTQFFPTLSANYEYVRHHEALRTFGIGVTRPEEEYAFSAKLKQPIFSGFSLINQYEIAALGLDAAKLKEKLKRLDIILEAKRNYFTFLKAQKLLKIATEAVKQLKAHKEVARNFYEVGMTPLNDLLQSQVELANANQELIVARNNLENAASNFNQLIRRPINSPVKTKDILEYTSFEKDLEYCMIEAENNRHEIIVAKLLIEQAKKQLELARKDYYPTVALEGTYYRQGTQWDVDGGEGISVPDGWDIAARATWNFWEWGKTSHGIKEKLSRLTQAELQHTDIIENIRLEVKRAYLRTQETERAILTVEKAIEQAKENFRINEERYKEQVATATNVLDAQTLLSRTMTNYYNALYEFKIARASLDRAMGQEVVK